MLSGTVKKMRVRYDTHSGLKAEVLFLESVWRQRCRDACHVHVRLCFGHDLPRDLADVVARFMWQALAPKEVRRVSPSLFEVHA